MKLDHNIWICWSGLSGSVHKLYRLKALITLEKVNTSWSVVKKKKSLNEHNFDIEALELRHQICYKAFHLKNRRLKNSIIPYFWLSLTFQISDFISMIIFWLYSSSNTLNWLGVVNFHCMQMSLEMSFFWWWLKWCTMFITFSFFGNDEISLKSRPLIFMYLYTSTQLAQNKSSNTI